MNRNPSIKIIVFLFFLFVKINGCLAQESIPEDSLSKYSYFLQGYDDSTASVTQGTGFFVHNNEGNFLVTAKHILSGCRFNGTKEKALPDEMILYYTETDSLASPFYSINIKPVKDTSQCFQFYAAPDIISYPVNDIVEKGIYPIDEFLPSYLPVNKGKIVIYGFPSFTNIDSGRYAMRSASKLEIPVYEFYDKFTYKENGGNFVTDSVNYTIKPADTISWSRLKGYSGSPVFLKDNDNGAWVFVGVVIAIDEKNNLLSIVKPVNLIQGTPL